MHMKHIIIILLILSGMFFFSMSESAAQRLDPGYQAKQSPRLLDRIDFGGYLGAQFGTVTMINVSPIASYRVTDRFQPGIGFTYQYYKDKRYAPAYTSSAYGANLFARYFVWQDLFAHVEYAPLYVNFFDYYDNGAGGYYLVKNATWVHDLMIGGGYRQWLGERSFISLMLLFNVNESYYSPYRNPIIRIGFGVGL